jgi:hypothetical protein
LLLSSRKSVKHLERDAVRIVLQLTEQCKFTRAFEFRSPTTNAKLVYPMDLSLFVNKLLFWCTAKPGAFGTRPKRSCLVNF